MNEYNKMVLSLAKDGEEIKRDITPAEIHLWHMATGIVGEAIELIEAINKNDKENILEELGDLCFYSVGYSQVADVSFTIKKNPDEFKTEEVEFIAAVGRILDSTKKICIYKKRDVPDMESDFLIVSEVIADMCKWYGFTVEQVLEYNKKKLGKRYPNLVYSDKMAQERNDKK